jgi:mono/diheme cytochrome c family protein
MRRLLVLTALLLPTLPACADGVDSQRLAEILELEGDVASGGDFYAGNCLSCHGADAAGGSAPAIAGATKDTVVEAALEGPDVMPKFTSSENQELADVATYVSSL